MPFLYFHAALMLYAAADDATLRRFARRRFSLFDDYCFAIDCTCYRRLFHYAEALTPRCRFLMALMPR